MKYLVEFWIELAVAVVLGALIFFGKKLPGLWRKAAARRFQKVIAYEVAKHAIIQNIQSISGAKRVVLCKTHNGGGIPKIGKKIAITIDWEEVDLPLQHIRGDWHNRLPDAEHLQMLSQLTREGYIELHHDELFGELKAAHDADHIVLTKVQELLPTNEAYWYLGLSFTDITEETAYQESKIRSCTAKLRRLLAKKATLLEMETWAKAL